MKTRKTLATTVPEVAEGLKVEKWLRPTILRSMASMRYLPNAKGEISDAANALKSEDRYRFLVSVTHANERVSAQTDFIGVIGMPLALGILTIVAAFDVSEAAIGFFYAIIVAYLFIYFYYRLMKATTTSILEVLKIEKGYEEPVND